LQCIGSIELPATSVHRNTVILLEMNHRTSEFLVFVDCYPRLVNALIVSRFHLRGALMASQVHPALNDLESAKALDEFMRSGRDELRDATPGLSRAYSPYSPAPESPPRRLNPVDSATALEAPTPALPQLPPLEGTLAQKPKFGRALTGIQKVRKAGKLVGAMAVLGPRSSRNFDKIKEASSKLHLDDAAKGILMGQARSRLHGLHSSWDILALPTAMSAFI
jgi:hypothetical protein